jgi:hypothetical protein
LLYYGRVTFNDDILCVREGRQTHRCERGDKRLQRHHILFSVAAGQLFAAGTVPPRNLATDHGLVKETVLAEAQMTNRLTLFFGAHLAVFALVLVLAR